MLFKCPKSRNIVQRKRKNKCESEITERETQLWKKKKNSEEEMQNRDLSLVPLEEEMAWDWWPISEVSQAAAG